MHSHGQCESHYYYQWHEVRCKSESFGRNGHMSPPNPEVPSEIEKFPVHHRTEENSHLQSSGTFWLSQSRPFLPSSLTFCFGFLVSLHLLIILTLPVERKGNCTCPAQQVEELNRMDVSVRCAGRCPLA